MAANSPTAAALDARLRRIEVLLVDLTAGTVGIPDGKEAWPSSHRRRAQQSALAIIAEHEALAGEPPLETRRDAA